MQRDPYRDPSKPEDERRPMTPVEAEDRQARRLQATYRTCAVVGCLLLGWVALQSKGCEKTSRAEWQHRAQACEETLTHLIVPESEEAQERTYNPMEDFPLVNSDMRPR